MTKEQIVKKLTSRKFWLAVAAFVAAFVGAAQGFIPAEWSALMMALVAGIYAACEAYVDGQGAKSEQTVINVSSTDKALVAELLNPKDKTDATA